MKPIPTGINAIPETTEYANGWNDCRKEAFEKLNQDITLKMEEVLHLPRVLVDIRMSPEDKHNYVPAIKVSEIQKIII